MIVKQADYFFCILLSLMVCINISAPHNMFIHIN